MCLYSKKLFPKRAEKDIICYKYLMYEDSTLVTPVTKTKVTEDQLKRKVPFKARFSLGLVSITFDSDNSIVFGISRGWIHTCKQPSNDEYYRSIITYKCIIPKGTLYYENMFGNEYASKEIKFIEKYYENY